MRTETMESTSAMRRRGDDGGTGERERGHWREGEEAPARRRGGTGERGHRREGEGAPARGRP